MRGGAGRFARRTQIVVGDAVACALLEGGSVKCWGAGRYGKLGSGNTDCTDFEQTPAQVEPVALGGKAVDLAAGWAHVGALLDDGTLR